jgi:hypothetical protein
MIETPMLTVEESAVLATCDIRSPNEAFENNFPCLSRLADFREGE